MDTHPQINNQMTTLGNFLTDSYLHKQTAETTYFVTKKERVLMSLFCTKISKNNFKKFVFILFSLTKNFLKVFGK